MTAEALPRKSHGWSLRRRLAVFLLVAILVLASVLAVTYIWILTDAKESSQALVSTYARKMQGFFSDQLAQIMYDGISMRYSAQVQDLFTRHVAGVQAEAPLLHMDDGKRLKDNVVDILLMDTQGEVFFSQSGADVTRYQGMWDRQLWEQKENRGAFFPILNVNPNAYLYSGPSFLYAVDVYQDHFANGPRQRLGVLVYLCSLMRVSSFVLDNENLAIEILDGGGNLLLSNQYGINPAPDTHSHLEFNNSIRYTGWNLRVSMTEDRPVLLNNHILLFSLLIFLFSAICVLGISAIVHESVQKPIASLTTQLQNREQAGNLRVLVPDYHDEIGAIGRHINDMLEYQNLLTKNNLAQREMMYRLEMDRKQAELSALRSQINPHFLYNSLECVRGMAVSFGAKPIEDIAVSLGNLFRYSIKGQNIVRVQDEIKMIRDYFRIVHHRFPKRYHLTIDIPPDLQDALIPKMILQPIVENAVSHGLEALPSGKVWLSGCRHGNELVFEVENDGVPLEPGHLAELQRMLESGSAIEQTERIGLLNICQRIRNQYGNAFGPSLHSRPAGGLLVRLRLPLDYADAAPHAEAALTIHSGYTQK